MHQETFHLRKPGAISRAWPEKRGMSSITKNGSAFMQHRWVTKPCSTCVLHICRLAHDRSRVSVADLAISVGSLDTSNTAVAISCSSQHLLQKGHGMVRVVASCVPQQGNIFIPTRTLFVARSSWRHVTPSLLDVALKRRHTSSWIGTIPPEVYTVESW